jgi:hypothetical protein
MQGVIKPDIYDPTLSRAYADLERHYGFVADPAKVRSPQLYSVCTAYHDNAIKSHLISKRCRIYDPMN